MEAAVETVSENAKKKYTQTASILYSERVYSPEAILSAWLNLSCFMLANSLIFYHMTRVKSLQIDGRIAGIIAILLMTISTGYTVSAIGPYYKRISEVIKQCLQDERCNDDQAKRLKLTFYQYMALGIFTSAINLGITFYIGKKTLKFFR
ncbi:MAG: hypothetical protein CMH04_02295 [Marinovum sp.]|nr:hypothetical protein [Marinovum sp.]